MTISDRGDITLELIGGFDLAVRTARPEGGFCVSSNERSMPLIYGRAGNQLITIQDTTTMRSESYFGLGERPSYHRISGTRAFVGVHLPEHEADQLWQGCWVHLENFAFWCGANGVRSSAELRSESAELLDVPGVAAVGLVFRDQSEESALNLLHRHSIRKRVSSPFEQTSQSIAAGGGPA